MPPERGTTGDEGLDQRPDFMGLALPFDTDDPEFARGVEVGGVFQVAKGVDVAFECQVHAANAEMVMRIAEATGRAVRSVDLDEDRMRVSFGERGSAT